MHLLINNPRGSVLICMACTFPSWISRFRCVKKPCRRVEIPKNPSCTEVVTRFHPFRVLWAWSSVLRYLCYFRGKTVWEALNSRPILRLFQDFFNNIIAWSHLSRVELHDWRFIINTNKNHEQPNTNRSNRSLEPVDT